MARASLIRTVSSGRRSERPTWAIACAPVTPARARRRRARRVAGLGRAGRLGTRPAACERPAGDLGDGRTGERAGDHVAGIVNPGMDPRIGDHHREGPEGDRRRGHHLPDPGGEGEGGSRVAGGKRARHGHSHVTGHRYVLGDPVRADAPGAELHRAVDDGGGERERGEAGGGRTPSCRPAGEGERAGGGERELRVVGSPRETAHGAIERRGRGAGDRGVDGDVQPLGVVEPTRPGSGRDVRVGGRVFVGLAQAGSIL